MPLAEDAGVGERIVYPRRRRGVTQAVLSGLLGRSEGWLSQIERGSSLVHRLTTIVDGAAVPRIEPARLLPRPFSAFTRRVEDPTIGVAPERVPASRPATTKRGGDGVQDRSVDLGELERAVRQGFAHSQSERWSDPVPPWPFSCAPRARP